MTVPHMPVCSALMLYRWAMSGERVETVESSILHTKLHITNSNNNITYFVLPSRWAMGSRHIPDTGTLLIKDINGKLSFVCK